MARDAEAADSEHSDASLTRRRYLTATTFLLGAGAAAGSAAGAESIAVETATPSIDTTWQTVDLAGSFTDPVVVTGALTAADADPATPRLQNVTASSFDVTVEEWLALDGAHSTENIGLLAIDPGAYTLSDGSAFIVDRVDVGSFWTSVDFAASFAETPVVFSQTQTRNGWQPVVTRHRNVSTSGLDLKLQEEEDEGWHKTETIGYVALPQGSGTLDGQTFETGITSGVSHEWQTISFSSTYEQPVFLADLQTFNGWDPCAVRYRNLTGSSVEVRVEEETSADAETDHVAEQVGYFVTERQTDSVGYGLGGYGSGGYGN